MTLRSLCCCGAAWVHEHKAARPGNDALQQQVGARALGVCKGIVLCVCIYVVWGTTGRVIKWQSWYYEQRTAMALQIGPGSRTVVFGLAPVSPHEPPCRAASTLDCLLVRLRA